MVITISNTRRYFEFILNITDGDYRYKYLKSALTAILGQVVVAGSHSYIHDEGGGWLIYLEIQGHIFIYGNNYSQVHLSYLLKKVDLKECQDWEIMGTLDLVYKLVKQAEIDDFTVIKDRYFYKLSSDCVQPVEADIEPAKPKQLVELLAMFQKYYQEEYDGQRNKAAGDLSPDVSRLILEGSLYIINNQEVITSFCSINNPDIGILFTKQGYRGQRFGSRLLQYCSKILLDENGASYVMTDAHNIASNRRCEKIGYQLIYEHTNLKI